MNKGFLILFTLVTFSYCLNAKEFSAEMLNSNSNKNIVDHSSWDKLLKMYVADNGDVNYPNFKKDAVKLNTYLNYLATKVPSEDWSKNEKLAYYINVYNANTIKLIIDNYPTKSIKDITNPWSKKLVKISIGIFSLSNIEHDILRKMNEPRIHFAINCASTSCPKLLNIAYTSENVEILLEQAAIGFINNSDKNQLSKNNIRLSKIFKWYKEDFTKYGNLIDYINQYSSMKILPDASISYLEYDWSLNEQH